MLGASGRALTASAVTFVSQAAVDDGLRDRLGVARELVAVAGTRTVSKKDLVHNSFTPHVTVDPETYEVRVNGEIITCEPAKVLPMAQRYFMY